MNLYHTKVLQKRGLRVSEIARVLNAEREGDDLSISGAAPLETAEQSDLSFVAHAKAFDAAASSRAGCLLVPPDYPSGRTLIRSRDPRAAFAQAVRALYPEPAPPPGVDPSASIAPDAHVPATASIGPHAVIASGACLGDGTRIGAGSVIGAGARIGNHCTLHPRVTIYPGVVVGDRAIIHSGCVLGADGFGFVRAGDHYEKFPQIGGVEIGDDVELGANTCVDRAALGVTRIGDGTKIDNLVHIAHNCNIGKHVLIAAQTGFAGGVTVGDYAIIGGQVGVGDKARIEAGAVVGSGAGILTSKIVRAGEPVWGTPARPLKQYLRDLANLARLPRFSERLERLENRAKQP